MCNGLYKDVIIKPYEEINEHNNNSIKGEISNLKPKIKPKDYCKVAVSGIKNYHICVHCDAQCITIAPNNTK